MKKVHIPAVLLFALIVACALSCKKKKGASPSNSKIAYVDLIHYQSATHYHIVYDALNNVDSIVATGGGTDTGHNGFQQFTYYTASYLITDETGNFFPVYTNVNGMMTEVVKASDSLFFTYDYYHSAQVDEVDDKAASTTATTYQWNNGDIVTMSSNGITDSIDYDNSRGGQQGDAWRIFEFLTYGQSYTKTNHLPTMMTSKGVWTQKYFYQFDGDGRISQFMEVINNSAGSVADDTLIYNYRY